MIKKFDYIFILIVFLIYFLICKNYFDFERLYSFGDSFFYFDTNLAAQKYFTIWNQEQFGDIFIRNPFSNIIFLYAKHLFFSKLSFIIFQKIYIVTVISLSSIGVILFYKEFKKVILKKNSKNKFEYFLIYSLFFLHTFILNI